MFSPETEKKFAALVTRYSSKRSAVIPMLMFAQDEKGHLTAEIVDYVARYLHLTPLEVEEVISFYSMLTKKPRGKYHLQVCTNISCVLKGADRIWEWVKERTGLKPGEVSADGMFSIEEVECIGACTTAPAMQVNYDYHENLTAERIDQLLADLKAQRGADNSANIESVESSPLRRKDAEHPKATRVLTAGMLAADSRTVESYLSRDGYKTAEKALRTMTSDQLIEEVKKSGLRGRGGAGFPAGMKWGFVPRQSLKPKYLVCNADESEPGTCKDRPLLEYDPHQLIEGMIIAGRALESHQGYIYIRGEYRYLLNVVSRAVEEAYARGFLGKNIFGSGWDFDLAAHTGAGAYICGEETALLESLEGKRGYPRIKPPFPAVVGLYGCPTVINNVETLSAIPCIIKNGGEWYATLGPEKNGGTRIFSVSGHVRYPGNYEVPMGTTLRTLIEEFAGGIREGHQLKAIIPGGSSTPVLPADKIDTPLTFEAIAKAGSMLGSGGVIVMDETTCMVRVAQVLAKFYSHESCGWCVPCREGTMWLKKIYNRFHAGFGRPEDIDLLDSVAKKILGHTHCPLGDAAAMPVISTIQHFRGEFEEHLKLGTCPLEKDLVTTG
jgi:NADH-quinone oxidoreductase subunit F